MNLFADISTLKGHKGVGLISAEGPKVHLINFSQLFFP